MMGYSGNNSSWDWVAVYWTALRSGLRTFPSVHAIPHSAENECSHQYASSSHFNYKANWALGMFHKLFPTRLAGDAWPYHYKSSSHFFFSFYFSPLLGKLGTRQYFHKVSGREIAQQKSGTKMTLSQYTWKKEYSSTCLSVLHAVTLYVLPVTRQTRH
jgi:hypothetical protein